MAKKQFKAESKRLLDLMVNSIYTHKEIFLRELISNASDALDKLYYNIITSDLTGISRDDFFIMIESSNDARTLTIKDNGIGMSKDDLEKNLGTIARSGSLEFKREKEQKGEIDIIGQFGVGFYASFMVADHVTVTSRAYGAEQAYCWKSDGSDGFTIEECEKDGHGTEIVLHIKSNTEDENYDEFMQPHRLSSLVRKYSDYIRYPIKMEMEHSRVKEGGDPEKPEYEQYKEIETLNSMVPLWKRKKTELSEDDYYQFYKEKFYDFENPIKSIHFSAEGAVTYDALLFIPSRPPFNYYTKEYQKGLQLYSSGVMIMESCNDLLPDYFGFVKGLVDSQDLSLNISRELLQHDRQLKTIAQRLEKKIKSELESMLADNRDEYEKFFDQFGLPLKYGIYSDYGMHKDVLKDLILFKYSGENATTTLKEYVERMNEEQKYIYYASGKSPEQIQRMPQTEVVLDKGFEILYLTDDVDEFALRILGGYDDKEFRSVSGGDLGFDTTDEKEDNRPAESDKELFDYICGVLDGKVKAVRASKRLKTYPICLTNDGDLSIEMEKVLNAMPDAAGNNAKAERVLEINENHPIYETLKNTFINDKTTLDSYARLLYTQALLIEGLPIDDPIEYTNDICKLITECYTNLK